MNQLIGPSSNVWPRYYPTYKNEKNVSSVLFYLYVYVPNMHSILTYTPYFVSCFDYALISNVPVTSGGWNVDGHHKYPRYIYINKHLTSDKHILL